MKTLNKTRTFVFGAVIFVFLGLALSLLASEDEYSSNAAKPVRIYYWLEPTPQTEFKLESPSFYYYSEGLQKFLENCDTSPVYGNETLNEIVGVPESVEGFNRVMFEFNDFFLVWVMRPLMKGYSFIIPKTGRKGIANIAKNVEFPVRTFSCFLQGRFADGGIDFSRFLINTVLGGAGAYDAAKEWFDMEEIDEDFGQAFASWGCGPGCYLTLPIHGPTTVRDGIGLIFDYGFDPKTWVPIPGVQAFCKMNEGSLDIDEYRRFTRACLDPYANIRDFWYIKRQIQVEK